MRQSVCVLLLAAVGCGVNAGKTFEAVDISGSVTIGDKPVSDVILNFQPTGAGTLPVIIPITDGRFECKASPGRYAWYFEQSKGDQNSKAFETIPMEYRAADLDRQIDVFDGAELEFTMD